jgi:hypothetical protein
MFNTIKDKERFDGWQNIDQPLKEFEHIVRRQGASVPFSVLEALLWASQVQSDEGKFWDPYDRTFRRFCQDLLQEQGAQYKITWDREYCLLDIERKEYAQGKK